MSIGLLVIAHNDAAVIERSILSARGMVDRMTVVVDEDSVDATAGICQGFGAEVLRYRLPGSMAKARNDAVNLVRGTSDYVLMLDPGDVLEGEPPARLAADVYELWVHDGGLRYPRIQLFKPSCGLRYEGLRTDEPVAPEGVSRSVAPKLVYKRMSTHEVYTPAAIITELAPWMVEHPEDARAAYDLAQAYRDAGQLENARQWYEKRLTLTHATRGKLMDPRTDEQRYVSALEIAFLVEHDPGSSFGDVTAAYLRAHELRPLRAEPLFHLACYLREKNCVASAWHFARRAMELRMPTDGLVLDAEVYEWKARAEVAVESWMLGDRGTALKLLIEIGFSHSQYKEWADEQIAAMNAQDPPERASGWPVSASLKEPG